MSFTFELVEAARDADDAVGSPSGSTLMEGDLRVGCVGLLSGSALMEGVLRDRLGGMAFAERVVVEMMLS